jgi:hypothetical protein
MTISIDVCPFHESTGQAGCVGKEVQDRHGPQGLGGKELGIIPIGIDLKIPPFRDEFVYGIIELKMALFVVY